MEPVRTLSQMVSRLRLSNKRRRVAVVCPNDPHTEYVIIRSLREEIAEYLLVTDVDHVDISNSLYAASPDFVRVYTAPTPDDAAALAVELVRSGEADVLMKGLINTDNLLRAVLHKERGLLPPGGILSHVAVAQIPLYHKLLFGCCRNSQTYIIPVQGHDNERYQDMQQAWNGRTSCRSYTLFGEGECQIPSYHLLY